MEIVVRPEVLLEIRGLRPLLSTLDLLLVKTLPGGWGVGLISQLLFNNYTSYRSATNTSTSPQASIEDRKYPVY